MEQRAVVSGSLLSAAKLGGGAGQMRLPWPHRGAPRTATPCLGTGHSQPEQMIALRGYPLAPGTSLS